MKNEFVNNLEENEKLIFYGTSDVSKTSKQYGRFILGFAILSLFWILALITIKSDEILTFRVILIFLVLSILTLGYILGIVYNICLKYKTKNNEYFVTNQRIAIYNPKNGFRIENISNIEHIGIAREKHNYGDISFTFYANSLIEQMKSGMSFEGVENPRKIVAIIIEINNKIHVYDDKIIITDQKH